MSDQEVLRRYALAVSLIPDADVAGDLFMDARSDDDLRERAHRWLRQNGFPLPKSDPPLPVLDFDQQAHAMHLARRGRLRLQMKRLLGIGAAAVALGAVFVLGLRMGGGTLNSLARAPAYASGPIKVSEVIGGLRLEVYHAESTPGTVTLWWGINGPGAATRAQGMTPTVGLAPSRFQEVAPEQTESVVVDRDKLLGRSTYKLLVNGRPLSVRVGDWLADDILVERKEDPTARQIEVNRTVEGDGFSFTVRSVTIAQGYTLVDYMGQVTRRSGPRRQPVAASADGQGLQYVGTHFSRFNQLEELFSAVPPGASKLHLSYPNGDSLLLSRSFELPWDGVQVKVVEHQETNNVLIFDVRIKNAVSGGSQIAVLYDTDGQRYLATTTPGGSVDPSGATYRYRALNVPRDAILERVVITAEVRPEPVQMEIDIAPR